MHNDEDGTDRRITRRQFVGLTVATGAAALVGCGDDDPDLAAVPVTVRAQIPATAASQAKIPLVADITGRVRRVTWVSESDLLLTIDGFDSASAFVQTPCVVVDTPLRFRVDVEDRDGVVHSDSGEVIVAAHAPVPGLAEGMAWDAAPFRHGVASGDPLPDGVLLWTRLTPAEPTDEKIVRWQIADHPSFATILDEGTVTARSDRDFTVQVDVRRLRPSQTYFYHFLDEGGARSAVGRTRTAPAAHVDRLRFAVGSCSSIYSGYFNAYRRVAERIDLDLFIHLGDYLYDFVDDQERVRIPDPYPQPPQNLDEWRERHAYYLADPDLRRARAMHPWAMIWDNHDLEVSAAPSYNGSVQAFREWNPIRNVIPGDDERIYRGISYGNLVDLLMLDEDLYRDLDAVPGTEAKSMLGGAQHQWLVDSLRTSTSAWRILGSQRLFGTVRINPVYARFIDGSTRDVFDPRAWDGYPEERSRLLSLLRDEQIDDNIVLSGDSHISVALDLVDDPNTPTFPSAGVEMLATSISRGNFDETLRGLGFDDALQQSVLTAMLNDTRRRNPHHVYVELTKHGYGTLDVTPDRVVAQFWYSEILSRVDTEEPGPALTVERGANRWTRASPNASQLRTAPGQGTRPTNEK